MCQRKFPAENFSDGVCKLQHADVIFFKTQLLFQNLGILNSNQRCLKKTVVKLKV